MQTTIKKADLAEGGVNKAKRTVGDRVPARISRELREAGIEIVSMCQGFAYARNGNMDNPTPRLTYVVRHRGRLVGSSHKLSAARELASDFINEETRS
jgi:hypothetical protein